MNSWNINVFEYTFFEPNYFWLLLIVPFVLAINYFKVKREKNHFFISHQSKNKNTSKLNWMLVGRYFLDFQTLLVFFLIVAILAKPSKGVINQSIMDEEQGIDIVLTLDISASMLAMDLKPNRLEASKRVMKEFINSRKTDRIGLVAYSGEAYIVCSPTKDHELLKKRLSEINGEKILELVKKENVLGGTAIGEGLATSLLNLQEENATSKIIILLTDGVNNAGEYTPLYASSLAKNMGIKVYTIGVGSIGNAYSPYLDAFGRIRYEYMPVEIDENTLMGIADSTEGTYFRATDENKLVNIYNQIDNLEKSPSPSFENGTSIQPIEASAFLNWLLLLFTFLILARLYFFPFNYNLQ